MFLTGKNLKRAIASKEITIDPFDDEELIPYGYYVHCGDEIWVEKFPHTTSSALTFQEVDEPYKIRKVNGSFIIPPHRVVMMTTRESFYLSPDHMGVPTAIPMDPRKPPLVVQVPILHPSWHGKILFTVFNPTPYRVKISVGERLFIVSFQKLV